MQALVQSATQSTRHGHAGPKGEGGLDDATGAGGAGGAGYKQTAKIDLVSSWRMPQAQICSIRMLPPLLHGCRARSGEATRVMHLA